MALAVLGLNARATWQVTTSVSITTSQKWLQLLFVWGVPVIGAVFVGHLLREERPEGPPPLDEQERTEVHPYVTQTLEQHVRLAARAAQQASVAAVGHAAAEAVGDAIGPESD